MFPEMEGEPGPAHQPVGGAHVAVGRAGIGPDVGVVVDDEAAAAIHFLRGGSSGFREALKQVEERRVAIAETTNFGGPIVHLRVDVDRVFCPPSWSEILIPEALEVGGETAGTAGGDQEVASVVKI